jgi:hypothetical protein
MNNNNSHTHDAVQGPPGPRMLMTPLPATGQAPATIKDPPHSRLLYDQQPVNGTVSPSDLLDR